MKENKIYILFLIYISLVLMNGIVLAENPVQSVGVEPEKVGEIVRQVINRQNLQSTEIGISIVSLNQLNTILYDQNASRPFTPASAVKLVTSAAILDYLGPHFRFVTKVYPNGIITPEGVLKGDLIIYGMGDPSLSDRFTPNRSTFAFELLAEQILQFGINEIRGNIIGDGTYFDEQEIGTGWSRDYLHRPFAARVTALTFNENYISFRVHGGSNVGDRTVIEIIPKTNSITFINNARTGARGSRNTIDYHRVAGSNSIRITGSIPAGQSGSSISVSVEDPIKFSTGVFKEILESKGIKVNGKVLAVRSPQPSAVPENANEIAMYISPPLSELLKVVNKNSHNLFSELFLKKLGKIKYGKGSYAMGIRAAYNFMIKTGVDLKGYNLLDGSGLSPLNKITPEQLVGILEYMKRHKYADIFYDSLAIPGVDGTLRRRLPNLSNNMRGKTGSIRGVRSLSGYMTTQSGEILAFAIISNNIQNIDAVRLMENSLMEKLAQL